MIIKLELDCLEKQVLNVIKGDRDEKSNFNDSSS